MNRYERILAEAARTPWAILPEKGAAIAAVLTRAANGGKATEEEIISAMAAKKTPTRKARGSSVALVPIFGAIMQRADLFDEMSGAVGCEKIGRQLDDLAASSWCDTIVLDIDSPGGSVYGVAELGAKIAGLKGKGKKCIAVANSMAASAAYWLASQADELVVTPGGEVGSIGVVSMHIDQSEALRAAGYKVSVITAGEKKANTHSYDPLSEGGRAEMQGAVDDYFEQFVRAVAGGRKTSLTAVRNGFGKGGMVRADQAVKENMADRVATLDDTLSRYGTSFAELTGEPGAEVDRPGLDMEVELRKRKLRM